MVRRESGVRLGPLRVHPEVTGRGRELISHRDEATSDDPYASNRGPERSRATCEPSSACRFACAAVHEAISRDSFATDRERKACRHQIEHWQHDHERCSPCFEAIRHASRLLQRGSATSHRRSSTRVKAGRARHPRECATLLAWRDALLASLDVPSAALVLPSRERATPSRQLATLPSGLGRATFVARPALRGARRAIAAARRALRGARRALRLASSDLELRAARVIRAPYCVGGGGEISVKLSPPGYW
jgi:hypothetical protein